jgi:hypothetical protein
MKRKSHPWTKRTTTKSVLRLPELEHATVAVLNSLTSTDAQRGYRHAIEEFVDWYCSEPRLAFIGLCLTLPHTLGISPASAGHHQLTPWRGTPPRLRGSRLRFA